MKRFTTPGTAALIGLLLALLTPAGASAGPPSLKKAIWGPVSVDGVSQFPIYADLGVGIYETAISWSDVAPTRPATPRDPNDPAYHWPSDLDDAISDGQRYGIRVLIALSGSPRWANGGRASNYAPKTPADFADFAEAAARRYPAVHHWLIWGEPDKRANFRPLRAQLAGRSYKQTAPRVYARLLDGAYGALKRVSRSNLVVGGNTWTVGDIPVPDFLRGLRLPSGKPPRMDLYGHNPFTMRFPDLKRTPIGGGVLDFDDLDTVARLVDRNLGRASSGRPIKLFLSEFTLPTDHANWEFNFWFSRKNQAHWLAAALRITRHWSRIYTLGWLSLYDDPERPNGDEVNRGLIDREGRKKPAYAAFRDG